MIVVSGASGQLGRRTVELLKERGDASSIVALSRTPEKIADLGVTARAADFDDPHSLVKAFDGAERLLIISTDQLDGEGTRVRQHGNAIEAAAKAGVGHVLYTSIVEASAQGNPSLLVPDHLATEKLLAESGLAYTVLRNSLYSELLLQSGPAAVASGVLAVNSGDGATGYVTREDCAAAAAGLLASGGHEGELLDITGPAALTNAEIADLLADVTGKPVRYQPLTDEQYTAGAIDAGMPEAFAHVMATVGQATREGYLNSVSDAVERLSGRKAPALADYLTANRQTLLGA